MKEIPLTRGFVAFVDDRDFDWLNQWNWFALTPENFRVYAVRHEGPKSNRITILMHRIILGPDIQYGDHKNGNGIDNQRHNLRAADAMQNGGNARKWRRVTSSQFKGVSWVKRDNCWRAYIKINYHQIGLGYFQDEAEAARAYDRAAERHFGEFANLNFPVHKQKQKQKDKYNGRN